MEVRTIKTCDGWKEVLFLDGALLPERIDRREAPSIEWVQVQAREFSREAGLTVYPLPLVPQVMLDFLNLQREIAEWLSGTLPPQTG